MERLGKGGEFIVEFSKKFTSYAFTGGYEDELAVGVYKSSMDGFSGDSGGDASFFGLVNDPVSGVVVDDVFLVGVEFPGLDSRRVLKADKVF